MDPSSRLFLPTGATLKERLHLSGRTEDGLDEKKQRASVQVETGYTAKVWWR